MGADLYITKITDHTTAAWSPLFEAAVARRNDANTDADKKKFQALVDNYYNLIYPNEGYFRDSYNGSSLMQQFGFSYWRDLKKYTDDDNNMSPDNARLWLDWVRQQNLKPITKEWLLANHCVVDDGENSPAAWDKYFKEKKERLEAFLQNAIDMDSPIHCSC